MAGRVSGKVALISGGARGQGASHARFLASEGARVIIGDVRDDDGEAAARELSGDGLHVSYRHLDVSQPDSWRAAVEQAESEHGKLDILVNNAGIAPYSAIADCTDEEWEKTIAVNQAGSFYGMRAAIPLMKKGGGGSIVNIASTHGANGAENYGAYIASKAAIIGMTKSAAATYGDDGIRANVICPGLVQSPLLDWEVEQFGQQAIDDFAAGQPIKRAGTAAEVSMAVLFLASDEASFVTGVVLPVDGGYLAA